MRDEVDSWFYFLILLAVSVAACWVVYIHLHPCLEQECHYSSYTWIGNTSDGKPVYGPGQVCECIRRRE